MTDSSSTPPDDLTFEHAIAITQSLLSDIAEGRRSEASVEAAITDLVRSEAGARGFFVSYLTDAVADHPSDAVVQALRSSPQTVAELMVKNLAMSAAMAIAHRRNQYEEMATSSEAVHQRSAQLIQLLQLPQIAERAKSLYESATTGKGSYQEFLDRWGYDLEQRQRIAAVVKEIQ